MSTMLWSLKQWPLKSDKSKKSTLSCPISLDVICNKYYDLLASKIYSFASVI